ncbi:MAG: hypothetical protein MN733_23130, partial [Nitrososphaera sp.]|nr:hypothetical protein [Nitrososphaera sp.]
MPKSLNGCGQPVLLPSSDYDLQSISGVHLQVSKTTRASTVSSERERLWTNPTDRAKPQMKDYILLVGNLPVWIFNQSRASSKSIHQLHDRNLPAASPMWLSI